MFEAGVAAGVVPSSLRRRLAPVGGASFRSGAPEWAAASIGPGHVTAGPHGRVLSDAARAGWPGAAELVVGDYLTGARDGRPAGEVLHEAASAVVADDDVELAVGAEAQHAAVVVAARGLARVRLQRAQTYERSVEVEA